MPFTSRRWNIEINNRVGGNILIIFLVFILMHINIDDLSKHVKIIYHFTIRISEVFVSNKSSIFITDPDDNDDTIEYDITRGNDRITATCTAYGGSPVPAFKW